jgi:phage shock protein E
VPQTSRPGGAALAILAIIVAVVVVLAVELAFAIAAGPSAPSATPTPSAGVGLGETVVPGNGGTWTNVTPDRLATMLLAKDFVLVNVKTPYIGEIDGTDLYIPYDQLRARAGELPAARDAKILVYCRSGASSAVAAQTLLDLGYTNVWNLAGGMEAWRASGRTLIQKSH